MPDSRSSILQKLKKKINEMKENFEFYLEITGVGEITRRYFVMNALDGALTMLGVTVGAYIGGHLDPKIVVSSGLSGAMAIGLSGISGAFLTEYAERKRELKEMEKSLVRNLNGTVMEKGVYFATVLSAIVDAIAPVLAALVVLAPYILSLYGFITPHTAFVISLGVTLVFIWTLGYYLGRVSKERPVLYGVIMLIVGMVTAFITYSFSTHL